MFANVAEVSRAYDTGQVEISAQGHGAHQGIRDRRRTARSARRSSRYETTVGRALLSDILPVGLPFELINKALKKKEISQLINASFRRCGLRETVIFADKLMQAGFAMATRAAASRSPSTTC